MWDSYNSDNDRTTDSWSTRVAIDDCLKKIRELEKKYNPTIKEKAALKELVCALEDFQEKCKHSWRKFPLFYSVRKVCDICNKEDRDYNYAKDQEKDRPKT